MVAIPPGSFTMGVPADEEKREGVPAQSRGRSVPQHRVTIQYSFSLGRYEVTQGQFATFVQATGHVTGTSCFTLGADGKYVYTPGRDWRNPGFSQTANDGAPTNGDYWRAPGDCSLHVARGGSWVNNPRDLRAG